MDTRDGRSERELVRAAVRGPGARVLDRRARGRLLAGRGAGARRGRGDRGRDRAGRAPVEPRAPRPVRACSTTRGSPSRSTTWPAGSGRRPAGYDAVCLDVDNGPEWTVTVDNAALYGEPDCPQWTAGSRRAARWPSGARTRRPPSRPGCALATHRRGARDPGPARRAGRGLAARGRA